MDIEVVVTLETGEHVTGTIYSMIVDHRYGGTVNIHHDEVESISFAEPRKGEGQ